MSDGILRRAARRSTALCAGLVLGLATPHCACQRATANNLPDHRGELFFYLAARDGESDERRQRDGRQEPGSIGEMQRR